MARVHSTVVLTRTIDYRERHKFAVRVEWFTVAWMVAEAVVSIIAGLLARSLLLTAFGLDSAIELVTGGVLLWRLKVAARGASTEAVETAERRAALVTAVALAVLCMYVLATAIADLLGIAKSEGSTLGILVSLTAVRHAMVGVDETPSCV